MEWLSATPINTTFNILLRSSTENSISQPHATLGILAFETARTMSRLVSLYKSLSVEDIKRLKRDVISSRGVMYLNSDNEDYLLSLAYKEKLEDLSQISDAVSRLSQKCSARDLQNFEVIYRDVKIGILDTGKQEYGTKNIERVIQKMEKYIFATSDLVTAIESLAEMEASDKKLQMWMKNLGPGEKSRTEFDLFEDKLEYQGKQVKYYKEISLWNKTFDKCVTLMGQAIFAVHARLDVVFAPNTPSSQTKSPSPRVNSRRTPQRPPASPVGKEVQQEKDFCLLSERKNHAKKPPLSKQQSNAQQVHPENDYCLLSDRNKFVKKSVSKQLSGIQRSPENGRLLRSISKSGPIQKIGSTRLFSRELSNPYYDSADDDLSFQKSQKSQNKGVFHLAPLSTLGGCGLTFRYAKLVILAECYLRSMGSISDDARAELYDMLPNNLKVKLKDKLKRNWQKDEKFDDGHTLAEGWRDALEGIMGWLGPMAHDTVTWLSERNLEKQMFDAMPGVLLMQTLHFADLEKTEAAIVEVLVGLSCIYRFEKRRLAEGNKGGSGSRGGKGNSSGRVGSVRGRGRGRRFRSRG